MSEVQNRGFAGFKPNPGLKKEPKPALTGGPRSGGRTLPAQTANRTVCKTCECVSEKKEAEPIGDHLSQKVCKK